MSQNLGADETSPTGGMLPDVMLYVVFSDHVLCVDRFLQIRYVFIVKMFNNFQTFIETEEDLNISEQPYVGIKIYGSKFCDLYVLSIKVW